MDARRVFLLLGVSLGRWIRARRDRAKCALEPFRSFPGGAVAEDGAVQLDDGEDFPHSGGGECFVSSGEMLEWEGALADVVSERACLRDQRRSRHACEDSQ